MKTAVVAAVALFAVACVPRPERAFRVALDGEVEPRVLVGPPERAAEGPRAWERAALAAAAILVEAARADDPRARDAALGRIESAGVGAEPVLLALARDRARPVARAFALSVLARRGDRGARRALARLAGASDPAVRAYALVTLDPRADADLLRAAATSDDVRERLAALDHVDAPRGEAWRRLLEERLAGDESSTVRAMAARRLARYGDEAEAALVGALDDHDASVASSAAAALVEAVGPRAVPTVLPLVSEGEAERALTVAGAIARGVAQRAAASDARGRAELERLVAAARARVLLALASEDEALRARAAGTSRSMPRTPGVPEALKAAAEATTAPRHRLLVVLAMRAVGGEPTEVARHLADLARDPGMVGVQAAEAAVAAGDEGALSRLVAATHDPDPLVRAVAAEALAREADSPAPSLFAVDDPDERVRARWAAAVLAARTREGPGRGR